MKFTVVWLPTAESLLADLWNNAQDRQAVTDAANTIDRLLGNDPQTKVTPVDQLYFLRVHPLVVLCDLNFDDLMVRVIEVRGLDQ